MAPEESAEELTQIVLDDAAERFILVASELFAVTGATLKA
jgi:hypothetical protein